MKEIITTKNNPKDKTLLVVLGMVGITAVSGIILSSPISLAEDASTSTSARAAVTVGSACSLSSSGNSHTATISPGNYQDNIGTTTITTICNDPGGYALYAIGYTGDSYDSEDHTKLIGEGVGQKITTGTSTSGSTSNWAMKLNKVTDSSSYGSSNLTITNSYDNYNVIPNTYTKVASYSSTTDTTLGSKLTTTYAAYIAGNQAADTYTGKVKYTMVHPNTEKPQDGPQVTEAGCIRYYPNGSGVVGTMGCQSVSSTATSAILLASNFSRQGYGFAGWSDSFDYATNPNAKFYGPQEEITFDAGTYTSPNKGLSLYAVWVKSQGNLQDSSKVSSICSALDTAPTNGTANLRSISALTDQRDNETYAIAKLADGNCWMIENLRLESTNSDNATGALAQGYGTSSTYGNFFGLANAESANFIANTSPATAATEPNSLYYAGTQSGTASINISQTSYAGFRMPRYNNFNHQTTSEGRPQNPTSNSANNSTTSAGMYSYGNYYSWAAAMANTTYYSSPTSTDADGKTSETVNTSLCPKGWKLPRGGNKSRESTNDLWSLVVTGINGGVNPANYDSSTKPYYTGTTEGTPVSNKLRSFPNNFLYSGYFSTWSASSRGSYGSYWSSTATVNYSSYNLRLYSTNVYPGTDYNSKYSGNSIRCVASSS